MRGQSLPPSEIKSLYGSITSSAVMLLSYVGVFTTFPPAPVELSRSNDDQIPECGPPVRPASTSRFQNEIRDRVRLRYQRNMTRLYLDRLGAHSLCHESLQIRIDGPIFRGHGVPARLRPPCRVG